MEKHEQLITSAKAGLTTIRNTLSHSPSQWKKHTDTVRTCVNNIETSNIMLGSNRLEERLWLITEIQGFAYFDADSGSIADLAAWCEREWNRVLSTDGTNIDALRGLGQAWLSKAQYWLAKIHQEEGSASGTEEDDRAEEKRRHTANYVEARAVLIPAVEFFGRAVQNAHIRQCLTGELLALRAEACMSLGNVSTLKNAQQQFKDAVTALKSAEIIPGYTLPSHLSQYLRENEYILRM
ncbi:uncharacterized protein LAJ45_11246 [Morchella importuna]|uniref:uncharacterized protein n=1 Tax=Morchella importuna TaxID=1174673 RepID=UPI001E8D442F|nr:uncharacterized protein LAJ45_11246 [Morchella importuna]KAH8144745.1 hypothetical protein LAJ45_11246 [Morchella importuna]